MKKRKECAWDVEVNLIPNKNKICKFFNLSIIKIKNIYIMNISNEMIVKMVDDVWELYDENNNNSLDNGEANLFFKELFSLSCKKTGDPEPAS